MNTANVTDIRPWVEFKSLDTPDTIFSRLFRQALFQLNIGPKEYADLMDMYITKHGVGKTRKQISDMRRRFNKTLSGRTMSYHQYINALLFLQVASVRFDSSVSTTFESIHSNKVVQSSFRIDFK